MGIASGLLMAAVLTSGTGSVPERRVLLPLDYKGVRITDGILRKQLDETKEFYLRIANDDLLLGFRRRAGLPAPGEELGGWYSDDVFHVFGQILSGLARMYAATGDPACREKADALFDGWRACIATDGYFYYSAKPNAPHYIYDKMVGGLVDLAVYAGRPDALQALSRITDWAEKHLDRRRPYGADGSEWYTLSENLYRAYLLTGDERYRRFAAVWEYTPYWKLYAESRDLFGVGEWRGKPEGTFDFEKAPSKVIPIGYHAYSHVNTLGGAALAYRTTGQPWYLATIRNAYDYLRKNECFATGGYGPDETIADKADIERRLENTNATFETQCGTWAIFKLCKNLIALTGDARYGDWIEEAAYNGIAATIPETTGGNVFYYSNYNPYGGQKVNHWDAWSCCTGTRPMAIADVADLIYFRAPDGIDVNLFVPSEAGFELNGSHIEVRQIARFPESPSSTLVIRNSAARGIEFKVRVRKAGWLGGEVAAELNGKPVQLREDAGHWLVLRRRWKDGDRLDLRLPMNLRSVPFQPGKPYPTAVAIGPVVLAFRTPDTGPAGKIDPTRLSADLTPSPGEPLVFHVRDHPEILAKPFYEFKEGESYTMYLDPVTARRIPYRRFRTEGVWRDSGRFWFGNQVGAWCECTFEGDAIRLIGWAYDDGGKGEIRIDGKVIGTIDQYAPGRDLPFDWRVGGLGPGKHTFRITVLADRNPASKDRFLNVGGLEMP